MFSGSGSELLEDPGTLAAFRRGEDAVLARVYSAYSARVIRFLVRRSNGIRSSPLDVDLAHQETFVRAFKPKAREAFDGVRSFEAYLLAIARTVAVDAWRAGGKVGNASIPLKDAPEAERHRDGEMSPEESLLQAELRRLVQSVLLELPDLDRRLAELRYVEELSQERAAEQLSLTRGELRVRERKLRGLLLQKLVERGMGRDSGERAAVAVVLLLLLMAPEVLHVFG